MSNTTEILLLANQMDKIANLLFLLRLANFPAVHIASDSEAFNSLA